MAVRVLDGVGDGFSGGDEHLHRLIWVHPGSGQPAAQGGACGGEVVTGAGNFSSSGRDGDKAEDNVVLTAAAWPEAGNNLVSQIIQCGGPAVVNGGGARPEAGNPMFQCTPATFDQTVGVRWPTMILTSKRLSEDDLKFRLAREGKSRWD